MVLNNIFELELKKEITQRWKYLDSNLHEVTWSYKLLSKCVTWQPLESLFFRNPSCRSCLTGAASCRTQTNRRNTDDLLEKKVVSFHNKENYLFLIKQTTFLECLLHYMLSQSNNIKSGMIWFVFIIFIAIQTYRT